MSCFLVYLLDQTSRGFRSYAHVFPIRTMRLPSFDTDSDQENLDYIPRKSLDKRSPAFHRKQCVLI